MSATTMPRQPFVLPRPAQLKKPAWLNDADDYHDRGDIDFTLLQPGRASSRATSSGSTTSSRRSRPCVNGLAQVFGGWIARYKVDGFRVDTARHVERRVLPALDAEDPAPPRARPASRTSRSSARSSVDRRLELSSSSATAACRTCSTSRSRTSRPRFAAGSASARGVPEPAGRRRLLPHRRRASRRRRRRSSGTTTWAAPRTDRAAGGGRGDDAPEARVLLGYDLMYLMRGAPTVYYGDEVGMMGRGGDQAARQDMFPTQVQDWQTEDRVGSRADRHGLVVRRHEPDRASCWHARRRCATRIRRSRPARRSCVVPSAAVVVKPGRPCRDASTSRPSTTGRGAKVTVTTATPSASGSRCSELDRSGDDGGPTGPDLDDPAPQGLLFRARSGSTVAHRPAPVVKAGRTS